MMDDLDQETLTQRTRKHRGRKQEIFFVGWTLVQRHACCTPLYLKYKIIFLINTFLLCALLRLRVLCVEKPC